MKKMFVLFAVLAMVSQASAFEIGGGAGAFIPMGSDAKDVYDTGYSANLYADMGIAGPVGVRVLGMVYRANGSLNGVSQQLKGYGAGALAMVKPDLGMLHPYAGIGYAAFKTEWGDRGGHGPGNHNKTREWGYGLIGQAGLNVDINKLVTVGANATYFMNTTNDSDLELGGLTAGVNAGIRF